MSSHVIWCNKDAVAEIVSRLSAKDLARLKCISKSWNNLIHDPLILRLHLQHSHGRGLSGYFIQFYKHQFSPARELFYITVDKIYPRLRYQQIERMQRIIMCTSNGILCSRKCRPSPDSEFEIYIGNPVDTTNIIITGDAFLHDDTFAFAFEPFGRSSSSEYPSFMVANIYRGSIDHNDKDLYHFSTYSSETGKWKISKEVCHCKYSIQQCKAVFASGCFNWLAHNRYVIAFNAEEDRSNVIQLPDYTAEFENQPWRCYVQRLGASEGYLHYASASGLDARVWLLADYLEPNWACKYHVDIVGLVRDPSTAALASSVRADLSMWEELCAGRFIEHLALFCFSNDILTLEICNVSPFLSYDCRMRKVKAFHALNRVNYFKNVPIVLPHSLSLAAIDAFKKLCRRIDPPFALSNDTVPLRRCFTRRADCMGPHHKNNGHCSSSKIHVTCEGGQARPARKCKSLYRRP